MEITYGLIKNIFLGFSGILLLVLLVVSERKIMQIKRDVENLRYAYKDMKKNNKI